MDDGKETQPKQYRADNGDGGIQAPTIGITYLCALMIASPIDKARDAEHGQEQLEDIACLPLDSFCHSCLIIAVTRT